MTDTIKEAFNRWAEGLAHGTYLSLSEHDKSEGLRVLIEAAAGQVAPKADDPADVTNTMAHGYGRVDVKVDKRRFRVGHVQRWMLWLLIDRCAKRPTEIGGFAAVGWLARKLKRPVCQLRAACKGLIKLGLVEIKGGGPPGTGGPEWSADGRVRVPWEKLKKAECLAVEPFVAR